MDITTKDLSLGEISGISKTQYEYKYFGKWNVFDSITDEIIRTTRQEFVVISEYKPEIWNEMEEEYTDEYSEIISCVISEISVEYNMDNEYTEGNEEYWRIDNSVQRNVEYIISQIHRMGYSYEIQSGDSPFYKWDVDLGLTTHEVSISIWDETNPEDEFMLYYWEVHNLDEGEFICYDEGRRIGYSKFNDVGRIIDNNLSNQKEIDEHLSNNLMRF